MKRAAERFVFSVSKTLFMVVFFFAIIGHFWTSTALGNNSTNIFISQSRDWSALKTAAEPMDCIVVSTPKLKKPSHLNHGEVFFVVLTRPTSRVINEPSIQVGYTFKKGAPVIIEVDGKRFVLFSQNDTAWLETATDETKFVNALKKGKKAIVRATSSRGNKVSYEFSLMGITSALNDAAKACNM